MKDEINERQVNDVLILARSIQEHKAERIRLELKMDRLHEDLKDKDKIIES